MESRGSCEVDLENFEATELRLGLPGTASGRKRSLDDMKDESGVRKSCSDEESCQDTSRVVKAQVVGWPPVRSYRKNTIQAKKSETENVGFLVKVSMDGAPYLRKIDLNLYKGYKELHQSLFTMFKCFSTGEFVTVYEDKDGDWMLVGDVPWEMFTSSCKRLRIMKGSEAIGLGSST